MPELEPERCSEKCGQKRRIYVTDRICVLRSAMCKQTLVTFMCAMLVPLVLVFRDREREGERERESGRGGGSGGGGSVS